MIDAAIALVVNSKNQVLISERQSSQSFAGFWEFPGGKIETGELAHEAVKRELFEEVGIQAELCIALLSIPPYQANARLRIFWIANYLGEAQSKEGQKIRWVSIDELNKYPMPKSNQLILQQLYSGHWSQESLNQFKAYLGL